MDIGVNYSCLLQVIIDNSYTILIKAVNRYATYIETASSVICLRIHFPQVK